MSLFPIVLGVRPSSDAGNSGSTPTKAQTEQTLKRDKSVCRFCGFQSEKYQRVIAYPAAGDPPFATACTFCEQCLFLERAGVTGAGILIWLPEIAQAQLNHIVRAIYVARADNAHGDVVDLANRTLDALLARRAEAKKRLGESDPMVLATILHESMNNDERKKAVEKLDGIRLVPGEKHMMRGPRGDINNFAQMAKYWRSSEGPYGKLPPEKWPELFKSASAAAGHA